MRRWTMTAVVMALGMFLSGCAEKTNVADTDDANLILDLPESEPPPRHAPERVSKLTVDDKDYTEPRKTRRRLKVEPKDGADSVKVVYSFWPNTYTNIIRTKVVKLQKGKEVAADFNKEDKEHPDQIKPIYFPTPEAVVREMCKMGKISKGDVVHDIGCGDGRLVIMAVKEFGAKKGVGIDIEPHLVKKSKENAAKEKVTEQTEFKVEDALKIKDLSDASVVLLYLGDFLNEKMQPVLQKTLKPGARVVSHRFLIGDWKPDSSQKINAVNNYGKKEDYELHLWTIKNLLLTLPESSEPPDYAPERVSKLTIDDKDFTEPRATSRMIQVEPKAGSDSVKVVYSFWPNTYTNIIRTKVVKLQKDRVVEADFSTEDKEHPDLIKPIYFPTPIAVVREMCKMAGIKKGDVVYDIGCGDGRLVIAAVKEFGAKKGVGIDINTDLVKESKKNAEKAGVSKQTEFKAQNALEIKDLSEANVVLLYLGDFLNAKMEPVLRKTLKPGSRVVSHRFLIGKWKPDETKKIKAINNYDEEEDYVLHLWTIK